MFPVNRIVVLLTPVFSAAAAVGGAWLVKNFPGLPVPGQAELVAIEISAATAAAGAALKWIHGHQAWEKRLAELDPTVDLVAKTIKRLDPRLIAEVEAIAKAEIRKAFEPRGPFFSPSAAPGGTLVSIAPTSASAPTAGGAA